METSIEISPELSSRMRNMSFFCAFLVVVIHCEPLFMRGTFQWWVKQLSEEGIARIAVPYFFTASGFLASKKCVLEEAGYRKLVLKRLRTLLVPFAIWALFSWLWILLVNGLKTDIGVEMVFEMGKPMLFAKKLGFCFVGMPSLAPLWYVRALLCLTLFFPVLKFLLREIGWGWLFFLFCLYGLRMGNLPFVWWSEFKEFVGYGLLPVEGLFYYSLGIWLSEKPERLCINAKVWHVTSLLFGLAIVAFHAVLVLRSPYSSCVERVTSVISCRYFSIPFLLYGVWGLAPEKRFPARLVSCSFAVFLIHPFVLRTLKLAGCTVDGLLQYFATPIFVFVIALGIAMAMHRWMPKMSAILFGGR